MGALEDGAQHHRGYNSVFFPSTVIAFQSGCVRTSLLLFPVFSNTKLGSEFDLAAAEPP